MRSDESSPDDPSQRSVERDGATAGAHAPLLLDVPVDRPRPATRSYRAGRHALVVPAKLAGQLEVLAREHGVTLYMTMLAAFQTVLHRWSQQDDIVVGSLNTSFAGTPTVSQLLERVRDTVLAAHPRQDGPSDHVQVTFQLDKPHATGVTSIVDVRADRLVELELAMNVIDGEQLAVEIVFARDLFDDATIVRFAEHFARVLEGMVESPGARVDDLQMLSQAERHQLLDAWNDTAASYAERRIHELFVEQAARTPDALAIVHSGAPWTYRELDRRSNQLARELGELGFGRGERIAVWLDRSADMITAILGVLKAGGTYVPVEMSWPLDRVQWVLANLQVRCIVTARALLRPLHDIRWRLPELRNTICLDVDTEHVPPESIDVASVRSLWDHVADQAGRVAQGGFVSSYTGELFSSAEVDQYRDHVVGLVRPYLAEDRRVLEIGCGNGELMFALAPYVAKYVGLDPSTAMQELNRDRARRERRDNIELVTGFAHDLGFDAASFDVVVLASTVQFFPGPIYLEHVLQAVLRVLRPGGVVIMADLLDARQKAQFVASVTDFQMRDPARAARARAHFDGVLYLDDQFLRELPERLAGVAAVSVLPRTAFANELRFRFDAILTKTSAPAGAEVGARKDIVTSWQLARVADAPVASHGSPDDIAYIIHTSGSTGTPKGVMVRHRPVINLIEWVNRTFEVGPQDRLLFVTSLSFDLSVYDVFGILAAGGSIRVASSAELREPARLFEILATEPITFWDSAPAALQQLVPQLERHVAGGALRRVFLSGDWIPVPLPDTVRRAFPLAKVISLGGATEATVWSNYYPIEAVDRSWLSIPYGKPIQNARYHVLDNRLEPCPIGVAGDLYIGGECLADGYINDPRLTANKFVPDPFSRRAGSRLYRTGDRARYWRDGNLEFLGRIDHQVKIRGFRIELGEIEAVLASHPSVAQAVVLAREDTPGHKHLVAYVVGRGHAPDASALRVLIQSKVPAYMVPAAIVVLASLPVTENGKLDRKALPAPTIDAYARAEYVAPRTATETTIAGIFAEVLGHEPIGCNDDFFGLGGDSLRATSAASRIRMSLGAELRIADIFRLRTVAALATALETVRDEARPSPLQAMPRSGPAPLSFPQEAVWLIEKLYPTARAYQFQGLLRFYGHLDVQALRRCLDEIIRRNEIFRTTFVEVDGSPVQIVHEPQPAHVRFVDLGAREREAAEREAAREIAEEMDVPFRADRLPLIRFVILRMGPEEHRLLSVEHHFVHDGWSFNLFLSELLDLYRAFSAGKASPLPEPQVQFSDYALWQRAPAQRAAQEKDLEYWKAKLAALPAPLELPTDHPRPKILTFAGSSVRIEVSAEICQGLQQIARNEGCTLFMAALAAFVVLLRRYTGQDDMCVGTGAANRTPSEAEQVMGMLVSTVALRTDTSGEPSFRELLRRVRDVTLEAYAHDRAPFGHVVAAVQRTRDVGRNPVFQTMFSFHDSQTPRLELPGLRLELTEALSNRSAKADLSVVGIPRGLTQLGLDANAIPGGMTMIWEYASDLFDVATVQRIAGHYVTLLEDIVAKPDRRIVELDLLTTDERRELLVGRNDTSTDYPRDSSIHELFAAQAARTPDATAVVMGDRRLTYRELDARANALARKLTQLGVGVEHVVAIADERSIDLVIGLVAILKSGAAYLPLDPASPRDRLDRMAEDAGARVILASRRAADRMPRLSQWIYLDEDIGVSDTPPPCRVAAGNIAYTMFTSGSTGTPKAVAIPHRAVVRLVRNSNFLQVSTSDVLFQFAPLAFDASTLEIWGALLNGAQLAIAAPGATSLEELGAQIARYQVTILWLTAGLFHQVVDAGLEQYRSVRHLLAGGDVLSPVHVRAALRALPGCVVHDGYGPTENTTFTTVHAMSEADEVRDPVPIGRPIANTTAFVLDDHLRPVPIGVIGRLYAGGDGLARGYHNRAAMTAAKFIPSPFGPPGARLYDTGDYARRRPDGTLEFQGRRDAQVKLRGFRIELGEIESILRSQPTVREAIVVVREDSPGDKRLVAYVATGGRAISGDQLRNALKTKLPDYMVPSAFVVLDALPLTPNGKVDRRALPVPEGRGSALHAAPTSATEIAVAEIFAELLRVPDVGTRDNFFELGGHSLLAMQMVARVRRAFGVELPLRVVFEKPTLGDLAVEIETATKRTSLPAVTPRSGGDELPLAFPQQRLWFLEQIEPGTALYNVPIIFRFAGALDADELADALARIHERHEVLRSRFVQRDGVPRVLLSEERLRLTRDETTESQVAARIAREIARPFDLASELPWRALLLRSSATDHVLVVTMHHIVCDGMSAGVFVEELAREYRTARPVPPLPLQYGDYAIWQHRYLTDEALDQQLAYWKRQLAGAPAVLDLPLDHPRPAVQSHRGGRHHFTIPAALTRRIQAHGQRHGATLYMTMLAAFQTLLHRYSRQDDIVVGTPIAGRTHRELEPLIGCFINMLVMRSDFAAPTTFAELLARAREATLAAYAHQDVPFEKLVDELHPTRTQSHAPLFQVVFQLFEPFMQELQLPGLQTSVDFQGNPVAKFDLSMDLVHRDDRLDATIVYATDLFDESTIARMAEHFVLLLESVAADPARPIARVSLLSAREQRQLAEWNATTTNDPRDRCVHQQFEAQAARAPGAVAVTYEGASLSYGELDRRANQLAHHLRSLGVGPESVVGIVIERSLEMVIGLLGILKAGGAYLPVDPSYPRARIEFMLDDARASILLTSRAVRDALRLEAEGIVCLDEPASPIWSGPTDKPAASTTSSNLAYVIYTSGSTGKPKGAMNQHGALWNRLAWMQSAYRLTADDRVLQKTPFSFDVSVWEFFWPLVYGATLVMARPEGHKDPAYLARLIEDQRVTTVHFVPSMLGVFLEVPQLHARCRSLERVICSGEALPFELQQRFFELIDAELHNLYGPTEAAIDVSAWACQAVTTDSTVPIGRPIDNVTLHVLGPQLEQNPVGIAGELFIGGVAVGRGYYRRPGLTASRFVPDPFGPPGARLYRTGDLAKWRGDGAIEYLGRLDHQVKIRGFRIELGEIEDALARLAEVKQVIVLAREDEPGKRRLVAYLVGDREGRPTAAELRGSLGRMLPDYMVPSDFVWLDAMPLTPSGKIDRKALPEPTAAAEGGEGRRLPSGPDEELLAGIWCSLLGRPAVYADDHFFELGGHSLLAMQMLGRVRGVLGVELAVRTVFEAPTLELLAAQIAAARTSGRTGLPPIVAQPRSGELPLSWAQQRLWFIEQLEPGTALYNVPIVVRLRGALDEPRLARALEHVHARHEVLRSLFVSRGGKPRIVISDAPFGLQREDASAAGEPGLRAAITHEIARPFDLACELPWRALLVRGGADDHALVLTLHHIVSDGLSAGVLVEDVSRAYRGDAADDPLPIQYGDYAIWQHQHLNDSVLGEQLAYWKAALAGAPALLDLPLDHPRPPVQSHRGGRYDFTVPAELTRALEALGRRHGATLYMTMLAAFQTLLHRYSQQDDIVVGTPIAGRTQRDLEPLIGCFINMLTMRSDFATPRTFADLLARTREATLAAYAHQDVPFETLVDELHPTRTQSHAPLFQVVFQLAEPFMHDLQLPGLQTSVDFQGNALAKFDLSMDVVHRDDRLDASIVYATDLFDDSTIARMAEHFVRQLESVTKNPHRQVADLPLLSAAEQQQLVSWNDTHVELDAEPWIPDRFAAYVRRAPSRSAITFEGETLSYRVLGERVDAIAAALQARGVGPDTIVGICLERGFDLVISVMAVLRAGGAYMPLDPELPPERLAFMLAHARAKLVVTNATLRERLRSWSGTTELVSRLQDEGGSLAPLEPARLCGEHLAYVIYTSGSTGQPKGVMNTHAGLRNRISWMQKRLPIAERDVVLHKTPFGFDVSVWELVWALAYGARLVIARPQGHRDASYLAELVAAEHVTTMHFVPSMLRAFLAHHHGSRYPQLRRVLCSGEALPADAVAEFQSKLDGELHNLYGPTEASIDVSHWECVRGSTTIPIGRPIDNTQLYVVDARLSPVPIGVVGELYIGGVPPARGYVARPDLTAAAFVPDPFAPNGSRMYRTGDVARFLRDGSIEFLGRRDGQVKIRGFRIELGEIEAALARHPAVEQCVVVARTERNGERRLVAYYVAVGSQVTSIAELREHLARTLPDYMVPATFMQLSTLPLSPNGKIDRKALPEPELSATTYLPPQSPLEEQIAGIWRKLLAVERVGTTDNFFELGGNSLLAMQVVFSIQEELGYACAVGMLFESPTVAALASRLAAGQRRTVETPIRALAHGDDVPLSFQQNMLLTARKFIADPFSDDAVFSYRIAGELDRGAFVEALDRISTRHSILRTYYPERDGTIVQRLQTRPQPVRFIDLSSHSPSTRAAELSRLTKAREPFDLVHVPPFRPTLVRLDEGEHVYLHEINHVAHDGWSQNVFLAELETTYDALVTRHEPAGAAVLAYRDFAAWQQNRFRGAELERYLAFYRRRVTAPPALELPFERTNDDFVGPAEIHHEQLPAYEMLAAAARNQRTTPMVLLMTAFAALLREYAPTREVIFATPLHNRERSELRNVLGYMATMMLARIDFSPARTLAELVQIVHAEVNAGLAHQDVTWMTAALPTGKLEVPFRLMFNYLVAGQPRPRHRIRLEPYDIAGHELPTTNCDLELVIQERSEGLRAGLMYRTDRFDRATAVRLFERYREILLRPPFVPET